VTTDGIGGPGGRAWGTLDEFKPVAKGGVESSTGAGAVGCGVVGRAGPPVGGGASTGKVLDPVLAAGGLVGCSLSALI
jgi:hypothetical protein